jgi:hypothetical protein
MCPESGPVHAMLLRRNATTTLRARALEYGSDRNKGKYIGRYTFRARADIALATPQPESQAESGSSRGLVTSSAERTQPEQRSQNRGGSIAAPECLVGGVGCHLPAVWSTAKQPIESGEDGDGIGAGDNVTAH